jgi:hypothetical protein
MTKIVGQCDTEIFTSVKSFIVPAYERKFSMHILAVDQPGFFCRQKHQFLLFLKKSLQKKNVENI